MSAAMDGTSTARVDEHVAGGVEVAGGRALTGTSWASTGGGLQHKTRGA